MRHLTWTERLVIGTLAAALSWAMPATAAGPIIWAPSSAAKDLSSGGLTTPKLQVTETGGGTDTVSVVTPSIASSWTFTLPISGGTNNYALTTNGSGTSSWSQVSLTAGVTGTLPLGNGGTGQTTAQAAINSLAGGTTNNRVLRGDGSNIALGQIDSSNFFTTGAAAASGSIGIVTASSQTMTGIKTFESGAATITGTCPAGVNICSNEVTSTTFSNAANLDSQSYNGGQYARVGNQVIYSFSINVDVTSGTVPYSVDMLVPLTANNFANAWEAAGTCAPNTASTVASVPVNIAAVASSQRIHLESTDDPVFTTSRPLYCVVIYRIL